MNRYRFFNISAAFERKILNIEEATAILKQMLHNLSRIRHVWFHLSKPTLRVCRTRMAESGPTGKNLYGVLFACL